MDCHKNVYRTSETQESKTNWLWRSPEFSSKAILKAKFPFGLWLNMCPQRWNKTYAISIIFHNSKLKPLSHKLKYCSNILPWGDTFIPPRWESQAAPAVYRQWLCDTIFHYCVVVLSLATFTENRITTFNEEKSLLPSFSVNTQKTASLSNI